MLNQNKSSAKDITVKIFEFCRRIIGSDEIIGSNDNYRANRFRGKLGSLSYFLELVKEPCQQHSTKPGNFCKFVSTKNTGETAFQRALYAYKYGSLRCGNQSETITWRDVELPITFSGHGRRRCVDLIGHTQTHGTFLCELKYAKESRAPAGNFADYAILEALTYYGIIARDHTNLDMAEVWHKNGDPFRWEKVKESRIIMILANSRFWEKARQEKAASRIRTLVKAIKDELGITVLLLATPDYDFRNASSDQEGRYVPQLFTPNNGSAPWQTAL